MNGPFPDHWSSGTTVLPQNSERRVCTGRLVVRTPASHCFSDVMCISQLCYSNFSLFIVLPKALRTSVHLAPSACLLQEVVQEAK